MILENKNAHKIPVYATSLTTHENQNRWPAF